MLLSRILKFAFSTKSSSPKIPKRLLIEKEKTKGYFSNFFKDAYISKSAFYITDELFAFLIQSGFIEKEFPLAKDNPEVQVNLMALHVFLIRDRFYNEKNSTAVNEADTIFFYCKSNYFVHFAEKLNDHLPVEDFSDYYVEKYSKHINVIEKQVYQIYMSPEFKEENEEEEISKVFRKYIFLNLVSIENSYIRKLFKYFKAHRNYLADIPIIDLISYKINWGLLDDPLELEKK